MDPLEIQAKVVSFAQRLLEEAHGDPVRALGLLVLVLEGLEAQDPEQYAQLVSEIRRVLFPETDDAPRPRAVQHLAGEMSWEGYQHCVRCGVVLVRGGNTEAAALPSGYVYQAGGRLDVRSPEDFDPCRNWN